MPHMYECWDSDFEFHIVCVVCREAVQSELETGRVTDVV